MQVSILGFDLFPTAGNTATATSNFGDIAIAIANGADSNATGGIFDFAFADGTNSTAQVAMWSIPVLSEYVPIQSDFDLAAAYGDMVTANSWGFFDVVIVP